MEGGTTFTFVTDGIESAMAQAREAAGDGDISIAGGADTINQFLAAGLHRRPAPAHRAARHSDSAGAPTSSGCSTACRRCSFASTTVRATPHVTHVTYALR